MTVGRIADIVQTTNALKADLVVLLGDYVAGHSKITGIVPDQMWARALARLRAPLGVTRRPRSRRIDGRCRRAVGHRLGGVGRADLPAANYADQPPAAFQMASRVEARLRALYGEPLSPHSRVERLCRSSADL
jgi:hypothetical protein